MFEKQCDSNLCQVGKAVELKKVLDFAVHPPNVLVETFFDQAGRAISRPGSTYTYRTLKYYIYIYVIINYDALKYCESGMAGPGDHPAKGLEWSPESF